MKDIDFDAGKFISRSSIGSADICFSARILDDDANLAHHARRNALAAVDAAKQAATAFDTAASNRPEASTSNGIEVPKCQSFYRMYSTVYH